MPSAGRGFVAFRPSSSRRRSASAEAGTGVAIVDAGGRDRRWSSTGASDVWWLSDSCRCRCPRRTRRRADRQREYPRHRRSRAVWSLFVSSSPLRVLTPSGAQSYDRTALPRTGAIRSAPGVEGTCMSGPTGGTHGLDPPVEAPHLSLLGGFELRRGPAVVSLHHDAQRMLAFLAVRERPQLPRHCRGNALDGHGPASCDCQSPIRSVEDPRAGPRPRVRVRAILGRAARSPDRRHADGRGSETAAQAR